MECQCGIQKIMFDEFMFVFISFQPFLPVQFINKNVLFSILILVTYWLILLQGSEVLGPSHVRTTKCEEEGKGSKIF